MNRHILWSGVVGLAALAALAALAGCEKKAKEPPHVVGPMPVQFGDCAPTTVAFVAGPRPQAFDVGDADPDATPAAGNGSAAVATTGGSDAGAEGRMGGQYRIVRTPRGAQGLDEMPTAGMLGVDGGGGGVIGFSQGGGGAFASLTGTGDISSGFDDSNIYGGLLGSDAGDMTGGFGFGRSGYGSGGGGTGWGTIGTGRYGTIGHAGGGGYGIGGGRGGMRGRTASVPTVAIGQPNANGDLDKAIIRRYVKRNIQKIQYCYEKQLLAKPGLKGTLTTQFFIAPSGNVASATATGLDPDVAQCVASVIQGIEFPKPRGGGGVQVNYPFTFRPAGDDATQTAQAGSGAPPSATVTAPDPSGGTGTAMALDDARMAGNAPADPKPPHRAAPATMSHAHALFGPVDMRPYKPGEHNPLHVKAAELADCFKWNADHAYGTAVVDLALDPKGGLTHVEIHGVADEHERDCVKAIAEHLGDPAAKGAERCSIAWGTAPVAQLPGIELDGAKLLLDGKPVMTDKPARAGSGAAPSPSSGAPRAKTFPDLVALLGARVKGATSSAAPELVQHQPLILRASDATPIAAVWRAMSSVMAAGDDFVLARAAGGDWRTVPATTLPSVPVPFGTGAPWNRLKRASSAVDGERVVLSVLVGAKTIAVGVSRVDEFRMIDRGPGDLDKLLAYLKEEKANAFFIDRTDVEIAADDDVTYGDLVNAIDAADRAGFHDWMIADRAGLAASL